MFYLVTHSPFGQGSESECRYVQPEKLIERLQSEWLRREWQCPDVYLVVLFTQSHTQMHRKALRKLEYISTFLGLRRSHSSFGCSGFETCSALAELAYQLHTSSMYSHTHAHIDRHLQMPAWIKLCVMSKHRQCRFCLGSVGAMITSQVNNLSSSPAWKIDFVMYTRSETKVLHKQDKHVAHAIQMLPSVWCIVLI